MKKIIPKIKIMKAQAGDSQEIRELENAVWKEEVVNKYDIPMFVRFGYVYVAKHGSTLAGAIVSFRTNKNEVYVCDLVVNPKYRRLHIGEKLYKKLLGVTKGKNIVSFLDPENIPTLELHKKLGAKVIKKVKNAYDLNRGIETGVRLFIRIKN